MSASRCCEDDTGRVRLLLPLFNGISGFLYLFFSHSHLFFSLLRSYQALLNFYKKKKDKQLDNRVLRKNATCPAIVTCLKRLLHAIESNQVLVCKSPRLTGRSVKKKN